MTVIQSILLGVIQGLTEFLPISSSGHLVIVPFLLEWGIPPEEAFVFDVLVQIATLAAVLAFFWKDFYLILAGVIRGIQRRKPFENQPARLGWYIVLSTIPAGLAGLVLKDAVESAFASPRMTSVALFGTALLLVIAERVGKREHRLREISWIDALIIGLFQILALFPGLSRSGSTITGAMIRDLKRPPAARFAFLMSLPIMLAAGLLATVDLLQIENLAALLPVYIPGFISAAVVGYFSIRWLIGYLSQHSLYIFAAYCFLLGTFSLVFSIWAS